jgi:hypothetical protein
MSDFTCKCSLHFLIKKQTTPKTVTNKNDAESFVYIEVHIIINFNSSLSNFGGQQPLVPFLLLSPPFFPIVIFWVHHPANPDDQHLLPHAMASGFSVASSISKREQLVFHYGSNSMPLSN